MKNGKWVTLDLKKIRQQMESVVGTAHRTQETEVDSMKNGKWVTLNLKDVKKDTLVLHGKYGYTPKSSEPSKVTDVAFGIHGEISIELDGLTMIRISDLVRDTDGQKIQLWHWIPLTVEEKLEKLIAVAEIVANLTEFHGWCTQDHIRELQTLIKEFKEES